MKNNPLRIKLFALGTVIATPLLVMLCFPERALAGTENQPETPVLQHLFHIERSKNANIVQYDAQLDADGKLDRKKPVVAYWIRLAEQGQVEKLSWVQKTFAYGFKDRLSPDGESVELDMKVDLGEPIKIIRTEDQYRATAPLEGLPSYLEKIFIQASVKGLSINIEFIEFFGTDIETGDRRYQKVVP